MADKNEMSAVIWTKYGPPDVLQLQKIPIPTPKDNEVLIKVYSTTVTVGDCEQRSLKLPIWYRLPMRIYVGIRKPKRIKILGMELAGKVETTGRNVSLFKQGDKVFAATGFSHMGTYAEYICIPEEPEDGAIATKPNNMSMKEATTIPMGAIEALCFLRQCNIQRGQKVLINGAGGTIGPFAIQLAKYYGGEVTAIDSTEKLKLLQSFGADYVVDYTRNDFTKSGETYDIILDIVGRSKFSGSLSSLNRNGIYLLVNPRILQIIRKIWNSLTNSRRVLFGKVYIKTEDLIYLRDLIEEGKIKTFIDKTFFLTQIVEAHRYVQSGRKKGNVIITIATE